ncbi:MAG: sulfate transporter CysZ [Candidatus Pelagadaptatus aseana]|uniref:sulfate transporter CysZ n=1 Tax=Candidatus Pelagadaptatus aseana TaxID=3120508 RepID=UPI0039B1ED2F
MTTPAAIRSNNLVNGLNHLTRGAQLIVRPELRWFILVPLLVNVILFVIITGILIQQFSGSVEWMLGWLPGWLDFVSWILWSLFSVLLLLVYGYSFSMITNLIAAPFYGILAEKTEALITGKAPDSEPLMQMIPRVLLRELRKLWYFLWRGAVLAIGGFILSFIIPPVSAIIPIVMFIWGAWCMAIQYVDYPADNHQTPFKTLREQLGDKKYSSLSFGGLVMLGTMVPLLNIIILPIAVVGATAFWVEELKSAD